MEEKRRRMAVWLTERQYAALEQAAREAGNAVSTHLRWILVNALAVGARKDGTDDN